MPPANNPKASDALFFKEALQSIEQIVNTLESSETSLETSLEEYEKGVNLIRITQSKLMKAEQKLSTLSGEGNSLETSDSLEQEDKTGESSS